MFPIPNPRTLSPPQFRHIKDAKISVTSPIVRALIGKGEGDTADVKAPGGSRSYEILAVRYG